MPVELREEIAPARELVDQGIEAGRHVPRRPQVSILAAWRGWVGPFGTPYSAECPGTAARRVSLDRSAPLAASTVRLRIWTSMNGHLGWRRPGVQRGVAASFFSDLLALSQLSSNHT